MCDGTRYLRAMDCKYGVASRDNAADRVQKIDVILFKESAVAIPGSSTR